MLPATGIIDRGEFGTCATRLSPEAGRQTSHEDLSQPPQLTKSCFRLWPCRFRRVCVVFSSCCGAFEFRLPGVSRFAVLVS